LHASIGNTFQPPQIDFGPEAGFDPLLRPETQRSVTLGIKVDALQGRLDLDLAAFGADFDHQGVIGQDSSGNPVLQSAGSQRYKGVELEGSYHPAAGWTLAANASVSDARYRDFSTLINGVPTQLAGRQLVLNSKQRFGGGLTYAPEHGWRASLTSAYTGPRYLDSLNTARVGGFTVFDASLGYRFERITLLLSAQNLGDRRDPILASELGEDQFYRMTARRIVATLAIALK